MYTGTFYISCFQKIFLGTWDFSCLHCIMVLLIAKMSFRSMKETM